MKQFTTTGGTVVMDVTTEEYKRLLDREVQATLGVSANDFLEQVESGQVDWDDPDTFYVAGILNIGQNGHSESS